MIDASHRSRSIAALFAGVGFSITGFIALVAVTPLAAEDLLGSARFSGVPSGLATMGTAAGTSWLASVMSRRGRRFGLLLGYSTAAVAGAFAALAVGLGMFPLLLVSIFVLGMGYGSSRLSRYAAADLYEPKHQARAIGLIVWAGTIGAVVGPTLLEPARRAGDGLGFPSMTGPFLLVTLAMALAAIALLLGFPSQARSETRSKTRGSMPWAELGTPRVQVALAALVVGQVVMLLIMTMTPIHVRNVGGALAAVGVIIAAHTFGMYALSPLSGYLSDRLGRRPIIVAAGALLIAASILSAEAGESQLLLGIALFLLGWGWNLGFVSGSALLSEAVSADVRMRVQGFSDSVVWASAAAAGFSSGVLLHALGYPSLCRLGAIMAVIPSAVIFLRRY